MEFIEYDKLNKLTTIKISDEELVDINSIVWFVKATFPKQDKTLLCGVDKFRLDDIQSKLSIILDGIGKEKGLKK